MPKEIGNLSESTFWDLSPNSLYCIIPPEIGKLTNLEPLLIYNKLTGKFPDDIPTFICSSCLICVLFSLNFGT
jgi:hypothetical protein